MKQFCGSGFAWEHTVTQLFFICSHCDRGHRYCSPQCREAARLSQRRCANGRHQRSPEGRLDHRDRQRQYRERQQTETRVTGHCVTDQGSFSIASPALFQRGPAEPQQHPSPQPVWWLRCRICGRAGRFIDPFPRMPRRR
jgi:hypothetical protein